MERSHLRETARTNPPPCSAPGLLGLAGRNDPDRPGRLAQLYDIRLKWPSCGAVIWNNFLLKMVRKWPDKCGWKRFQPISRRLLLKMVTTRPEKWPENGQKMA